MMSVQSIQRPYSTELLHEVVSRISEAISPEAVILFGSRAYGTAKAESDLDFVIVIPDAPNPPAARSQAYEQLYAGLRGLLFPVDLLVYTRSEFEERRGLLGTAVGDAIAYGKVMYGRA